MEPSVQDDFKWFGEGFDGFPKRLPEDTVEYAIYVIDNKLEASQKVSNLREVLQNINAFTKDLLKDYIWQRDSFSLELKLKDGML
jgi:SGT1 protein